MLDAAQAGASLYIMDGSGLHFIMSGAGLRAGFDGYLSEMLGTLRRYRLQEQSVAAVLVKILIEPYAVCLLYTSPSPRDKRQSRMPSSA